MPRKKDEQNKKEAKTDLPERLKDELPPHAQEIYQKTLESAYKEYRDPEKRRSNDDRESTAHKVAWSAVKKEYEKGNDGKWHRKSDAGDSE